MLIAYLEPPSLHLQGDQLYRTVAPCRALAQFPKVYTVSGFWLAQAGQRAAYEADVLVLCQAVDADFLPLLSARRAAGKITVFEINDHFAATQPWNPLAAFCSNPLMLSLTMQLASSCDGLQFSSPGLQQRFGELNPRQLVLPNQLEELPPMQLRPADGSVRIGFGGSPGHRDDVQAVVPALAKIMAAYPQVRFVSMVQHDMRSIFAALPPDRCEHWDAGDMQAYRRFVSTLDIGIAPLLRTPFNLGRSDVKFLEYSAGGAAAVCSDVGPYNDTVVHGDNGMLFGNSEQFSAVVATLIEQPNLRHRCVRQAHATLAAGRLLAPQARRQLAFYRQLGARIMPRAAMFKRLIKCHPTVQLHAPRYARLAPNPVDAQMLAAIRSISHSDEAVSACQSAVAMAPDNYLGHLVLGQRHHDAGAAVQALQQAAELNPDSCAARHALARRYTQQANIDAAAGAYHAILDITPKWAPAHEGLGLVAMARKDKRRACEHFAEALQANRYYRASAARLAMLAMEAGELQLAHHYLIESVDMGLATDLEHWLLAEIYCHQQSYPQARTHLQRAQQLGSRQPRVPQLMDQVQRAMRSQPA